MRRFFSLLLVQLLVGLPLYAVDRYVATTGSDAADGSIGTPWLTIQHAADSVLCGDVVNVAAGTYNERVLVDNSCTVGNGITFQGAAAATTFIDGGDVHTGWSLYSSCSSVGVYRKSNATIGYTPQSAAWENKSIAWISDAKMTAPAGLNALCTADGTYWDGRVAMAGQTGGFTYIRYRDGRSPNDSSVKLSPDDVGAFGLDGADYITIKNFTIRNSYNAVRIYNSATNNILEDNILQGGYQTVFLYTGTANNLVQNNDVSSNYIYADIGHPEDSSYIAANVLNSMRVLGDIWGLGVVSWDTGADNRVTGNTMHHSLGGLSMITTVSNNPALNAGTEWDNNDISYCVDYCIDLSSNSSAANVEIHDNAVYEYWVGMRIGTIFHGPLYIYRNRFSGEIQGVNTSGDLTLSFFGATQPSTGIWIYHNSFAGADEAISVYDVILTNVHFVNNAFSSFDWKEGTPDSAASTYQYNWVGGVGASGTLFGGGSNNTVAAGTYLWDLNAPLFDMPEASPARETGIDISTTWLGHAALPGFSPGYFAGSAPDAGAVQFGDTPPDPPDPGGGTSGPLQITGNTSAQGNVTITQ